MHKILNLIILMLFPTLCMAGGKQQFEIRDGQFLLDGKAISIHSGEMHYARVPHQYWHHRLQMMKGMGLNCVATYVFWNLHETAPGQWDFAGDKDLAAFVRAAGEEGMMVILRPGPYACAEWEFGGYPWWLQNEPGMVVRGDNEAFLSRTEAYIKRLYDEVGSLQSTKGGPIIMIQCENEFGSYVSQRKDIPMETHKAYLTKIEQQIRNAGFDVPLFTSDGTWLFDGGSIPGALPTANGEGDPDNLKKAVDQYHGGVGPYMVAEFYPGWLSHWAEPFPQIDASYVAQQTETYLKNGISFNFYMAHGGTNFGFMSGANYDKRHDIQPDLTSYDYDAPISEAGWTTPKYDSIRAVIKKYASYKVPEAPAPIPVIEIPSISLGHVGDVIAMAESQKAVQNSSPLTFEQLGQGYGYVLYTRHFNQPISGTLAIPGLRDYAVVYVNDEKVGVLNRNTQTYTMEIDVPFNSTLRILVENMGRINYGSEIVNNTKGIISPVTIDDKEITGNWKMYGLPMSEMPEIAGKSGTYAVGSSQAAGLKGFPAIYEGQFQLDETGDTFLDMSAWGKGIVFVNGHNLGRYWQVGPQQTLYVPGCWLNKGSNTIVVFEQLGDTLQQTLKTVKQPILDDLRN